MSAALLRRLDRLAEALDAVVNPPKPLVFRILMCRRPGPLDFDIIPSDGPDVVTIDMRNAAGRPWKASEPGAEPVPLPQDPEPPADAPEPRPAAQEEALWDRVRLHG
jgi:hypothetical protein